MKKTSLTRGEILTIALIALVFTALCGVAMNAYLNRDNRWFRIVSPTDEQAVEIMAVTRLLQPYVRTASGNLFFCSGGTWRDTCEQVTARALAVVPAGSAPAAAPARKHRPLIVGRAVPGGEDLRQAGHPGRRLDLEMAAHLFVGEQICPGLCPHLRAHVWDPWGIRVCAGPALSAVARAPAEARDQGHVGRQIA